MASTSRAANSIIRLSGMHSGLDTEALVEAMSAATKNRIDNLTKKKTALEIKQTLYRDIINKITEFKDKYFDVLKPNTYLKSTNLLKGYSASIADNKSGLTVKTSTSSKAGSYTVSVSNLATKATWTGGTSNLTNDIKLDLTKLYNSEADADDNFSLSVSLGSTTKTIKFENGSSESEMLANMNNALKKQFGTDNNDNPMVSIDSNGKMTTQSSVTLSVKEVQGDAGINNFKDSVFLNLAATGATGKAGETDEESREKTLLITLEDGTSHKITMKYELASDYATISKSEFNKLSDDDKQNYEVIYKLDKDGNEVVDDNGDKVVDKYIPKDALPLYEDAIAAGESYNATKIAFDKNNEELQKALNTAFGEDILTIEEGTIKADDGSKIAVKTYDGNFSLTSPSVNNKSDNTAMIKDLGLTGREVDILDENGDFTGDTKTVYDITINGKTFTFGEKATINSIMDTINNGNAGVKLSYSTTNNAFKMESTGTGTTSNIEIGSGDDSMAFFNKLGFTAMDDQNYSKAKNAVVNINGDEMEIYSNSFTYDGTTFTVSKENETFDVTVKTDNTNALNAVKSFIDDYNALIEELNTLRGTKKSGYEPLTDDEKAELSESEINKWEEKVKEGMMYQDKTIGSFLSSMRQVLYSSVKLDSGKNFGLYSIGITTSEDYLENGKLMLDENAFLAALEKTPDAVEKLFSGTDGIFAKFEKVLTEAVHATGTNKGSFVRLAGLDTGTAALENTLKSQIDEYGKQIDSLYAKYDKEQDRYWAKFTALETAMAKLNEQQSSLSGLFMPQQY